MDGLAGNFNSDHSQDTIHRAENAYSSDFIRKIWHDLGVNKDKNSSAMSPAREQTVGTAQNFPLIEKHDPRGDSTPPPHHLPPLIDSTKQKHPRQTDNELPIGKVYELRRLKNRSADHSTPDAVVRIPANFDPNKPVHLAIYNHGWGSNAENSYSDNRLDKQMAGAPPNTVLIIPEWQKVAGARSANQGNFKNEGLFKNMLQEVFDKTPELKGKTLQDVDSISIYTHSGGYVAAETELYKNGLSGKVKSITLLDSLYDPKGFDPWLSQNIKEIAAGKKQFNNIFEDTKAESYGQAARIEKMLTDAGLSKSIMYEDYKDPQSVVDASTIASHPIVFKYSLADADGLESPHLSIPHLYVGPVEAAAANREKQIQKKNP